MLMKDIYKVVDQNLRILHPVVLQVHTHDENYTCQAGGWGPKDVRGFDWFKNGKPDFSANETNSAWLIRDGAINFLESVKKDEPFFLYLPFQNIHDPYTCE